MPKFIDLTGKRFGHFTVIERDFNYKKEKNLTSGTFWKVKCDCGNEKIINGAVLKGLESIVVDAQKLKI